MLILCYFEFPALRLPKFYTSFKVFFFILFNKYNLLNIKNILLCSGWKNLNQELLIKKKKELLMKHTIIEGRETNANIIASLLFKHIPSEILMWDKR